MKEIVNYRKGQFTDYVGNVHHFVVAAVSTTKPCDPDSDLYLTEYDNAYGDLIDGEPINKALLIGIAICNPRDEFDEEKGKKIAYNKAVNVKSLHHPAIYTTRPGYINTAVVEAVLDNIVNYIGKDPGSVIPGYNDAEKKHAKKIEDELFVQNSSEELLNIAENIKFLSTEDRKKLDKLVDLL